MKQPQYEDYHMKSSSSTSTTTTNTTTPYCHQHLLPSHSISSSSFSHLPSSSSFFPLSPFRQQEEEEDPSLYPRSDLLLPSRHLSSSSSYSINPSPPSPPSYLPSEQREEGEEADLSSSSSSSLSGMRPSRKRRASPTVSCASDLSEDPHRNAETREGFPRFEGEELEERERKFTRGGKPYDNPTPLFSSPSPLAQQQYSYYYLLHDPSHLPPPPPPVAHPKKSEKETGGESKRNNSHHPRRSYGCDIYPKPDEGTGEETRRSKSDGMLLRNPTSSLTGTGGGSSSSSSSALATTDRENKDFLLEFLASKLEPVKGVHMDRLRKTWVASWLVGKRRITRIFSFQKYGFFGAREQAIKQRSDALLNPSLDDDQLKKLYQIMPHEPILTSASSSSSTDALTTMMTATHLTSSSSCSISSCSPSLSSSSSCATGPLHPRQVSPSTDGTPGGGGGGNLGEKNQPLPLPSLPLSSSYSHSQHLQGSSSLPPSISSSSPCCASPQDPLSSSSSSSSSSSPVLDSSQHRRLFDYGQRTVDRPLPQQTPLSLLDRPGGGEGEEEEREEEERRDSYHHSLASSSSSSSFSLPRPCSKDDEELQKLADTLPFVVGVTYNKESRCWIANHRKPMGKIVQRKRFPIDVYGFLEARREASVMMFVWNKQGRIIEPEDYDQGATEVFNSLQKPQTPEDSRDYVYYHPYCTYTEPLYVMKPFDVEACDEAMILLAFICGSPWRKICRGQQCGDDPTLLEAASTIQSEKPLWRTRVKRMIDSGSHTNTPSSQVSSSSSSSSSLVHLLPHSEVREEDRHLIQHERGGGVTSERGETCLYDAGEGRRTTRRKNEEEEEEENDDGHHGEQGEEERTMMIMRGGEEKKDEMIRRENRNSSQKNKKKEGREPLSSDKKKKLATTIEKKISNPPSQHVGETHFPSPSVEREEKGENAPHNFSPHPDLAKNGKKKTPSAKDPKMKYPSHIQTQYEAREEDPQKEEEEDGEDLEKDAPSSLYLKREKVGAQNTRRGGDTQSHSLLPPPQRHDRSKNKTSSKSKARSKKSRKKSKSTSSSSSSFSSSQPSIEMNHMATPQENLYATGPVSVKSEVSVPYHLPLGFVLHPNEREESDTHRNRGGGGVYPSHMPEMLLETSRADNRDGEGMVGEKQGMKSNCNDLHFLGGEGGTSEGRAPVYLSPSSTYACSRRRRSDQEEEDDERREGYEREKEQEEEEEKMTGLKKTTTGKKRKTEGSLGGEKRISRSSAPLLPVLQDENCHLPLSPLRQDFHSSTQAQEQQLIHQDHTINHSGVYTPDNSHHDDTHTSSSHSTTTTAPPPPLPQQHHRHGYYDEKGTQQSPPPTFFLSLLEPERFSSSSSESPQHPPYCLPSLFSSSFSPPPTSNNPCEDHNRNNSSSSSNSESPRSKEKIDKTSSMPPTLQYYLRNPNGQSINENISTSSSSSSSSSMLLSSPYLLSPSPPHLSSSSSSSLNYLTHNPPCEASAPHPFFSYFYQENGFANPRNRPYPMPFSSSSSCLSGLTGVGETDQGRGDRVQAAGEEEDRERRGEGGEEEREGGSRRGSVSSSSSSSSVSYPNVLPSSEFLYAVPPSLPPPPPPNTLPADDTNPNSSSSSSPSSSFPATSSPSLPSSASLPLSSSSLPLPSSSCVGQGAFHPLGNLEKNFPPPFFPVSLPPDQQTQQYEPHLLLPQEQQHLPPYYFYPPLTDHPANRFPFSCEPLHSSSSLPSSISSSCPSTSASSGIATPIHPYPHDDDSSFSSYFSKISSSSSSSFSPSASSSSCSLPPSLIFPNASTSFLPTKPPYQADYFAFHPNLPPSLSSSSSLPLCPQPGHLVYQLAQQTSEEEEERRRRTEGERESVYTRGEGENQEDEDYRNEQSLGYRMKKEVKEKEEGEETRKQISRQDSLSYDGGGEEEEKKKEEEEEIRKQMKKSSSPYYLAYEHQKKLNEEVETLPLSL
ncbi:ap2 domain transcription factor ap2iii-3 [Cystoisospora suis]|uniref:Ap2 domain transcription factor ap2iii-3 n=1 Tax=Cystoisospora suis TaxID=483139 RepID=A0A2C6KY57_9APIC|nr:ap2 domain transcription factor ap2iii-3 [Cystoisospora suis]